MNGNKIILINAPDVLGRPKRTFPNGYTNIGSILLEKGYQVSIIDGAITPEGEYYKKLLTIVERVQPLFVGISAMTSQLPGAVKTASMIKDRFPTLPIIWGGVHPTLFPEETIWENFVDLVVVGEGEEIMLEIAEYYTGQRTSLAGIKGIMFRDRHGVGKYSGKRVPPDLNQIPLPKYDELYDVEKYVNRYWDAPKHRDGDQHVRMIPIVAGMGCPYRCTYCINTIVYRGGRYYPTSGYRGKSARRILDEIELLIDKYGCQYVNFVDEIFFQDRARIYELLDGIQQRQLKFSWSATVRADFFKDDYINDELLERLRGSGCLMLSIGSESGSQKMLDYLKKDCAVEQSLAATEMLNRHRIFVRHSFITGLPTETHEDRLATIDFIKKLISLGPFTLISYPVIYRPMPAGPLYQETQKLGFKGPQRLTEWTKDIIEAGGGLIGEKLPWIGRDGRTKLTIYYLCEILGCESGSSISWWWRTSRYNGMAAYLFNILRTLVAISFEVRRKYDFWRFPVEPLIYESARKLKKFAVRPQ